MKKEPAKCLNFPNLKRKRYQTTHPRNPGNFKQDKCLSGGNTLVNMLAKQLKLIAKGNIYKITIGEKKETLYSEEKRITADFSSEIIQTRRPWVTLLRYGNEKVVNTAFYNQRKSLSK